MAKLTDRVRFTVPKDVKDSWKRKAAARGLTLSAFLRDVTHNLLADRAVTSAKGERGASVL